MTNKLTALKKATTFKWVTPIATAALKLLISFTFVYMLTYASHSGFTALLTDSGNLTIHKETLTALCGGILGFCLMFIWHLSSIFSGVPSEDERICQHPMTNVLSILFYCICCAWTLVTFVITAQHIMQTEGSDIYSQIGSIFMVITAIASLYSLVGLFVMSTSKEFEASFWGDVKAIITSKEARKIRKCRNSVSLRTSTLIASVIVCSLTAFTVYLFKNTPTLETPSQYFVLDVASLGLASLMAIYLKRYNPFKAEAELKTLYEVTRDLAITVVSIAYLWSEAISFSYYPYAKDIRLEDTHLWLAFSIQAVSCLLSISIFYSMAKDIGKLHAEKIVP